MNADRRKRLSAIAQKLVDIQTDLEAIRDEEQDAFDNLPESIQGGEKGQTMEECISTMDDAVSSLSDAQEATTSIADS